MPSFKLNMAIPVRCDKKGMRRLEKTEEGNVELDLVICMKPYPRVVIATGRKALSDSQKAILERLIKNENGYRQRCFEIKEDSRTRKWHLLVSYEFPARISTPSKERIIGVDLGYSCPLYAAINNGHARLGWRAMKPLSNRIRDLQTQILSRRREIQRGGSELLSQDTARSGRGRKRKLQPIDKLQGKIDRAYKTLNHQMSAALIKFAENHGAGVIQMEDLTGLKDKLSGSFLDERWRYHELQSFIEYKAIEAGIEVRKVKPQYTSRRCSKCGYINVEFTREYRDRKIEKGKSIRFECPECQCEKLDADYNAAKNLATLDIEKIIELQLKKQELQ